jgi:hypothetical protein
MIERHLDFLQEIGDRARAREFLTSECTEASEEVKRLAVRKRRAALRIVAKTTVSLAILVAARVILSYLHII